MKREARCTENLRYAAGKFEDARRFLDSGDGVNLVPDYISTALLEAMDKWLTTNGYKPDRGKGWLGTRLAFREHAPEALCSELLSCLSEASSLEYFLFGSEIDEEENLPSLDEWKILAYECLNKAARAINLLCQDLIR